MDGWMNRYMDGCMDGWCVDRINYQGELTLDGYQAGS
jgi:hypothetical protein